MKIEEWSGFNVRFVEVEPKDWWAVLDDVAIALGLTAEQARQLKEDEEILKYTLEDGQEVLIINEIGIYAAFFLSGKQEAKDFRRWAYEVIKLIRERGPGI